MAEDCPANTRPSDFNESPFEVGIPVHVGHSSRNFSHDMVGGVTRAEFNKFIMGEPNGAIGIKKKVQKRVNSRDPSASFQQTRPQLELSTQPDNDIPIAQQAASPAATPSALPPVSRLVPDIKFTDEDRPHSARDLEAAKALLALSGVVSLAIPPSQEPGRVEGRDGQGASGPQGEKQSVFVPVGGCMARI